MFVVLGLWWQRLKLLPMFLFYECIDIFNYVKNRTYKQFDGWGLHIYLGMFGQGKTCSMVRDAYQLACKYPDITIITNLKLCNFPETVKILPLRCGQDILQAPDKTIVLIDEIGTIFNSRDFAKSKESVPKLLFQHICQCRHRKIMMMGTVQRWGFLDKQLRDITSDVTVCSAFFPHPFSRMITNRVYDAYEYDLFCSNPMRSLLALSASCFIQTQKVRNLYDTKEMVDTLFKMDYIPDDEIMANRGEIVPTFVEESSDKKKGKKALNLLKKGG